MLQVAKKIWQLQIAFYLCFDSRSLNIAPLELKSTLKAKTASVVALYLRWSVA